MLILSDNTDLKWWNQQFPLPPYNKLNWDKITNTFHYMVIINKNQFLLFVFFFIKLPEMQGMCIGLQLSHNSILFLFPWVCPVNGMYFVVDYRLFCPTQTHRQHNARDCPHALRVKTQLQISKRFTGCFKETVSHYLDVT